MWSSCAFRFWATRPVYFTGVATLVFRELNQPGVANIPSHKIQSPLICMTLQSPVFPSPSARTKDSPCPDGKRGDRKGVVFGVSQAHHQR